MKIADRKHRNECGAYADARPVSCSLMIPPEEVFLFPSIDELRRIGCDACGKACHALNPPEKRRPEKVFAVWPTDDAVRTSGSSGGDYSALGDYVLETSSLLSAIHCAPANGLSGIC